MLKRNPSARNEADKRDAADAGCSVKPQWSKTLSCVQLFFFIAVDVCFNFPDRSIFSIKNNCSISII